MTKLIAVCALAAAAIAAPIATAQDNAQAVADLQAHIREEEVELAREEAQEAVTAELPPAAEIESPLASSSDEGAASESDTQQDLKSEISDRKSETADTEASDE